jgi:tetratricopeptide (TPR) repeat protein
MKRVTKIGSAAALLLLLVGACGGEGPEPKTQAATKPTPAQPAKQVSAETAKGYNDALKEMVDHDRANDWTDATCKAVAQAFLEASTALKSEGKSEFPEALYNAGLALQRCNSDAEAKAQFQKALDINAQFHRARVQLALYMLKEKGDAAIEPVIRELMQAVKDAQFQNVEALVNLAMLQMKRRSAAPDGLDGARRSPLCERAVEDGLSRAQARGRLRYRLRLFRLAVGERDERGRRSIAQLVERGVVQVADGVAGLVVAGVVCQAGGTPPKGGLLRCLDALGAGEESGEELTDLRSLVGLQPGAVERYGDPAVPAAVIHRRLLRFDRRDGKSLRSLCRPHWS